jgi:AraC-like DNA-binding protein
VGTTELAFRVMNTAEDLREAICLIEKFQKKVCPTRHISQVAGVDSMIFQVSADGLDQEHSAAAEITTMLMYMFGLASFVGEFIPIRKLYSRSKLYTSFMNYNKDANCPVEYADFTGIEFETQHLDMPKRANLADDPVSNAIRWGLLADKVRPIIERNHLPLLSAEGLLQSAETKAKQRNVDARQKRRIARNETEFTVRDLEKSIKASKAMVLISTTDKTISQIGFELGFSDERSFRRFFQDVAGCSPLEYRNVYQEAAASEGRNHFRSIMEAARTLRDQ